MLAAHPGELMQNMGEDEQALQKKAEGMLVDFEHWMGAFSSDNGFSLYRHALASWNDFYSAFELWKSRDSQKIVDGMVAHWLDLERLWLSVKDQVDADVQWRPRLEEQQKQIMQKLAKFGPTAIRKLEEEKAKLRAEVFREHSEREGDEDFVAMGTLSTSPSANPNALLSTSPTAFPAGRFTRRQTVAPTSLPPVADSVRTTAITEDPKLPPTPSSETPDAHVQQMVTDAGHQITNEQLAHELIMDPDFQLKPKTLSPLEERVKAVAQKVFWDNVRREFSEGNFDYAADLIADIKQQLLAMVSANGKIAAEVNEALDLDLIRQQVRNKTYDLVGCLRYIQRKMLQLCAPVRDAVIQSIAQQIDFTSAFQIILSTLEEMKFDLMNYRLQSLRPHLKAQAVEYERTKFEAAVAKGQVTQERTREWLAGAVKTLKDVVSARNPESVVNPSHRVKFEDAYNEALISLIFSNTPVDPATAPETLAMDVERIFGMQNEVQAVNIVAALLTLTKSMVPAIRDDRASLGSLKENLYVLLKSEGTTTTNLAGLILQTIQSSPRNLALPENHETLIKSMVERTLSHRDPVYSLISRRVQAIVRGVVEKGAFKREAVVSGGLEEVKAEIEGVAWKVARLAKHDKEVHGAWYDAILRELV